LARTFVDYGTYMATVNGFIPRVNSCLGNRTCLLSVVLGLILLNCPASAQNRSTSSTIDPGIGAKCQMWHQKALSGQWFTKREGQEFKATEDEEDKLRSIPACRSFFILQEECQAPWAEYLNASGGGNRAEKNSTRDALLNAIAHVAGCKSIVGLGDACKVLREPRGRGQALSPELQSVLRACADESIASRTSGMLRPAV
jgi:hypothetical protein